MVVSDEYIEKNFPLHKLVWENDISGLEKALATDFFKAPENLEKLDCRGRTPLLLAVVLGNIEAVELLLKNNASATFEHSSGWNVVHEAVCRGDPELLRLVLEYKDVQKQSRSNRMIPDLLRRLADAPDFYVEIKFELSSWMPFVGSVVPGSIYRIYKMGSKLRVDTATLDSDPIDWQKCLSVIFQGNDNSVKMIEIYHASAQAFSTFIIKGASNEPVVGDGVSYRKVISQKLSNPAMIAYIDLEKIEFERNKTVFGWGSDKIETIGNFECKVFNASNVQFVTKLRTEHLSEADKYQAASKNPKSQLHDVLQSFGTTESNESSKSAIHVTSASKGGEGLIKANEYFDVEFDLRGYDVGVSREIRTKINKFRANLWLSEDFPANFQEQIMPIIDIMSLSNSMFSKLKQFIQMQIPAGFPLKIEIPFFHVVNCRISFHNIFATEQEVYGVSRLEEDNGRITCVLDEDLFEPPPHYYVKPSAYIGPMTSSDDDLFTWTVNDSGVESSMRDQGRRIDIYEALNAPRAVVLKDGTPDSDTEEQLLQRAIEESLILARLQENPTWRPSTEDVDTSGEFEGASAVLRRSGSFEELQTAIDLSRRQVEEDDRLRQEEEDALKKVLELSLLEK